METISETLNSGRTINYKIVNGTAYHVETPDAVVRVLENARQSRTRIRFYLGDVKTGKSWNDLYDVTGYVGRSTGNIKIPILIANTRSMGGGAILDHCIIKIKESKGSRILYQADNFQQSTFEIKPTDSTELPFELWIDGKLELRCESEASAQRYIKRLS